MKLRSTVPLSWFRTAEVFFQAWMLEPGRPGRASLALSCLAVGLRVTHSLFIKWDINTCLAGDIEKVWQVKHLPQSLTPGRCSISNSHRGCPWASSSAISPLGPISVSQTPHSKCLDSFSLQYSVSPLPHPCCLGSHSLELDLMLNSDPGLPYTLPLCLPHRPADLLTPTS